VDIICIWLSTLALKEHIRLFPFLNDILGDLID